MIHVVWAYAGMQALLASFLILHVCMRFLATRPQVNGAALLGLCTLVMLPLALYARVNPW